MTWQFVSMNNNKKSRARKAFTFSSSNIYSEKTFIRIVKHYIYNVAPRACNFTDSCNIHAKSKISGRKNEAVIQSKQTQSKQRNSN